MSWGIKKQKTAVLLVRMNYVNASKQAFSDAIVTDQLQTDGKEYVPTSRSIKVSGAEHGKLALKE